MERQVEGWNSVVLNQPMEMAVYGHYGPAFLFFPFDGEHYLGYEEHGAIDALRYYLDAGRIKIFTVSSIERETWLSDTGDARKKSIRHQQYNRYITEEVVPFIARNMRSSHPTVYTCGISIGALHAVNSFLRRPDLFDGTIGLSGRYDLKTYTAGYYDNDVYFNSPIDYLANLTGPALTSLRQKHKVYLLSGTGEGEDPDASWAMGQLMGTKGIPNWVDLWGADFGHTWETWLAMLPKAIEKIA